MTQAPDLRQYDYIVVSSSGGKDSQALLDYVYDRAVHAGVEDRLHVVHADLGEAEWEGTTEVARKQVAAYALEDRFHIVHGRGQARDEEGNRTYYRRDLLEQVEERGLWPGTSTRYCTSDNKRGPIRRVYTSLSREFRKNVEKRRVRILEVLGLRAEESSTRARRDPLEHNASASTKTTKYVDTWLPLLYWTEDEVWSRIDRAGTPSHPAYRAGLNRASCFFCIFAPKNALVAAAQADPDKAERYVEIEERIDHTFKDGLSAREVLDEARERNEAGLPPPESEDWCSGFA